MISRYGDGSYLASHENWHDEDAAWKAKQVDLLLTAEKLRPASICDVGCGTGGVLAELRRLRPGVRMVGYEVSTQAVAIARSRHPDVEVIATDRPSEEQFDLMLMLDVFEHVEDYLGFLRRCRDLAQMFIFHIPLDMSVQAVLRMSPLLEVRTKTGHLHYFSRETALATLRDAGYATLSERFTKGALELSRQSPRTRMVGLPRRMAYRVHPGMAVRLLGGFSLLVLAERGESQA